jgi:PST family polysaccharide transporter
VLQRVFRTFGWAAFAQFGRQALQLISIIVLARLLSPQDFGVMSLATVVTVFVALFRDMGTGAALIRHQSAGVELLRNLFTLNILLGAGGGLLTASLAPSAARFFDAPILEPVLQVLAVSLAVGGLAVVPQAVLERESRFDRLAQIEIGGVAMGVVTGISMAYHGWGIWSLVGQSLATTIVTTVLLVLASGARPTCRPEWKLLRGVASYTLNLFGFNVFNYLVTNADRVLIGKLLGAEPLGYYSLAYQIALGPVRSGATVVSRVLFPSLARLQHDHFALGKEYLNSVGLMVLLCFPLMALLVGLGDVGTRALLGHTWLPMVPILQVLALVAFVKSASMTLGTIYMTTGRTDILMRLGLATGILSVIAFWIGTQWGALGVALAYAVLTIGITYPIFRIAFRLIGLRVRDVWHVSAHPGLGSVIAGFIAWSVARIVEQQSGAMTALLAGALAGISSYVLWSIAAWRVISLRIPMPDSLRIRR